MESHLELKPDHLQHFPEAVQERVTMQLQLETRLRLMEGSLRLNPDHLL